MGSVNHGTQNQTYNFYEEASGEEFNKRNVNIRPRGIYKGGYLTRVSDSEITLSPFTVEIGDDDTQVCVKTSATATINNTTLDSGTISSATPYIILRWAYVESSANYVEVRAVNQTALDAIALTNDIVVGKCNFTGSVLVDFDYTDRTFLNVQNLFFKVETSSGLYAQLRAGRIQTATGYVLVPEQTVGPFSVPASPNSRIDLVYIDTDGTVSIAVGSAAPSPSVPSYARRLVVAQVKIVNGDTSIPADRITDVRAFITAPLFLGADEVKAIDTIYLAATAGEVRAFATTLVDDPSLSGYKGTVSPPATLSAYNSTASGATSSSEGAPFISFLVQKGQYWKVTRGATGTLPAVTVQWTPIGS